VLPRALLAEFGLSKMLLGSSGGSQFLVVLPEESRSRAAEFCSAASQHMLALSGGKVKLVWAMTENLGDWSDIRKRLLLELHGRIGAPSDELNASYGAPESFVNYAADFRNGKHVAWSPEHPAAFAPEGKHQWAIGSSMDEVPLGRHAAPNDEDTGPASLEEIASRAQGQPMWGVLRGDVDDFAIRLRRAPSVEEHLQLSMMYKQFFLNELQTSCLVLPEYWRKVTLLYTGGQDFAVAGSWDALIGLAREIQRLFAIFTEANLKEYAGPEGKAISMSIVLASQPGVSLSSVYAEAGEKLESAKAAGHDSVWLFGRTLDWKQLADAAGSRETMIRTNSAPFIGEQPRASSLPAQGARTPASKSLGAFIVA
jgi:CRISPR-associated protein Csm1